MEPRTIEGSWEEILSHAPELAGLRVRLTVLPPYPPQPQQRLTLDQTLRGRIGRIRFMPPNLAARTKEAFADILTDTNPMRSKRCQS